MRGLHAVCVSLLISGAAVGGLSPEDATTLAGAKRVAFSPDGKTIATAHTRVISLWDAGSGQSTGNLEGHTGEIYSLVSSPDGALLASSSGWGDKTARVFDLKEKKQVASIEAPSTANKAADRSRSIVALGFGPDNKTLITGGTAINEFSLPDGTVAKSIAMPPDQESFALMPDCKRAVSLGKFNGKLTVWDLESGKPAAEQFKQATESTPSMGGSMGMAGGQKLSIASFMGQGIFIFDVGTMAFDHKLGGFGLQRASFSQDGSKVAYGTWNTTDSNFVVVADAKTGKDLHRIGPFSKDIVFADVALSPDGKTLVAVPNSPSKPALLWHLP